MKFSFFLVCCLFSLTAFSQDYYLLTGTYTSGGSKGIYVYRFNTASGAIDSVNVAEGVNNPSFLDVAPNGEYVYAVNENGSKKNGELSAFRFDKNTGALNFINKQSTGGADPCYVSVHKSGKFAVAANYSGGSFSVLPINDDGSLAPYSELINHKGKSVNTERQEKAHVHAVKFSPDYKYLLTPDLGIDKVMIYSVNAENAKPVTEKTFSFVNTKAGNGPRHITFHPTKPYAYLMEELSGTVSVYSYKNGRLVPIQNITSHPANYTADKGSADIHVSPDGKFLYASNRGQANSLAIYSIDNATGTLRLKGFNSTLGSTPRNFAIDPTGNYLLVANQNSNNIVIFKRNLKTGMLTPTGKQIKVPNPVCLVFLKK